MVRIDPSQLILTKIKQDQIKTRPRLVSAGLDSNEDHAGLVAILAVGSYLLTFL